MFELFFGTFGNYFVPLLVEIGAVVFMGIIQIRLPFLFSLYYFIVILCSFICGLPRGSFGERKLIADRNFVKMRLWRVFFLFGLNKRGCSGLSDGNFYHFGYLAFVLLFIK